MGRLTWHLRSLRWLVTTWQSVVNGFQIIHLERRQRLLVFSCTHYDRVAKRCDSYRSRPGICRNYPVRLLCQPWPELFDECGHSVVVRNASGMRDALARTHLTEMERRALEKKLLLIDRDDA